MVTPMQDAHMNVGDYPDHIDIMRIAEVLTQQAGEPAAGAVSGATSFRFPDSSIDRTAAL